MVMKLKNSLSQWKSLYMSRTDNESTLKKHRLESGDRHDRMDAVRGQVPIASSLRRRYRKGTGKENRMYLWHTANPAL
jgi:hypothetical protein